MTPPEPLERIAAGESQTMEFKTSFDEAGIESLVAFEFDGSIQRKERFAYSLPALRDVLLDAVVHRSCRGPGTPDSLFETGQIIATPGTTPGSEDRLRRGNSLAQWVQQQ